MPFQPPKSTTRFCFESYALAANVRAGGDWRGDSGSQFTADVAACTCVGRTIARTAAALASATVERQVVPMESTTLTCQCDQVKQLVNEVARTLADLGEARVFGSCYGNFGGP